MIEKLYYTIAEVSQELGVSQPTLRFWEREFVSLKPYSTSKGLRKYSKQDVEFLKKLIFLTKDCGYTLEGAKKILKTQKGTKTDAMSELAFSLNKIKDFLVEMKSSLKQPAETECSVDNNEFKNQITE